MATLRFLNRSGSKNMSPIRHLIISVIVGIVYGFVFYPSNVFISIFVATISGTLIDVDHFVVGRLYHGDWRFLRDTFSSFWDSILDIQSVVDDETEFPGEYRLFSHSVILIVLMSVSMLRPSIWFDIAFISVAFHLFSDLFADCFLW